MITQLIIKPKELHLSSQQPLTIKLIFKRILNSIDQEKFECKPTFVLKNNTALLNHLAQFNIPQNQLSSTIICIVLISIRGREINFLGNGIIEPSMNSECKIKLQKCRDNNAYMLVNVQLQHTHHTQYLKQKRQLQSYDNLPSTYQISHVHYKNDEILRDITLNHKTISRRQTYSINKHTNSTIITKKYNRSPSPRLKSPQPITIQPKSNKHQTNYSSINQKLQMIEDKINNMVELNSDSSIDQLSKLKLSQLRQKNQKQLSDDQGIETYQITNNICQYKQQSQFQNIHSLQNQLESNHQTIIQQLKLQHNKQLQLYKQQIQLQQKQIATLTNDIIKKQELIDKITKLYQDSIHQTKKIATLESQVRQLKEENHLLRNKLDPNQQRLVQLAKELQNTKNICLDLQMELSKKQNEIKINQIKIDNILHENENYEQELQLIISNNKYQLSKKRSISKIQLDSNNLTNTLKLQNTILKNQIMLMYQQIQTLNSLLNGTQPKNQQHQIIKFNSEKISILETRLQVYEQQLTEKKIQLAEIINLIWEKGSSELIKLVDKKINQIK